jgi:hypothetical protein
MNAKTVISSVLVLGVIAFAAWYATSDSTAPPERPKPPVPDVVALPELADENTEFLWSLEHHANVLVQLGFKTLGDALQSSDRPAMLAILADSFEGSLFAQPRTSTLQGVSIQARRQQQESETVALSASEFVDYMLARRAVFSGELYISFGVKTLSPLDPSDLAGSWNAYCQLRMWGEVESGGPAETTILFRTRVGQPDKVRLAEPGWMQTCSIEQLAEATSDRYLLVDATEKYSLDPSRLYDNWKAEEKQQGTGGIYLCDYNRDAIPDLLVTDWNQEGYSFFQGQMGGGFKDVTLEVGLARAPYNLYATFIDIDGDGWEDLVHGNGMVYRNEQGQRFTRDSTSNFRHVSGKLKSKARSTITGMVVADYDLDGDVDIYLTRASGTPTSWLKETRENAVHRNQLLKNLGNGQWEDVTEECRVDGGGRNVFTAAWLDVNGDRWPDLYVTNEFGDGVLYVNRQEKGFEERDLNESLGDFGIMGMTYGDVDNDGRPDLYVASMYSKAGSRVVGNMPKQWYDESTQSRLESLITGSELYRNVGDLKFEPRGQDYQVHDVGWAWGPAMADLNNDGWLDIYATAGYMSHDRNKPDG